MFENAKWIWNANVASADCYVEFCTDCEFKENDIVRMRISSSSNYAFYLNGVFVDSGQYADYPHYKIYDVLDLNTYIVSGRNRFAFIVWYCGLPSFNYAVCNPGLLFEIELNGKIVCSSNETVLSRKSKCYISGRKETITAQLGPNFHVDLQNSDDWMMVESDMADFEASTLSKNMPQKLYPREIRKLLIEPRVPTEVVSQGIFTYLKEGQDFGNKMQHAALSFFRMQEMGKCEEKVIVLKKETQDGLYIIMDLQKETVGYLDFDIEIPQDCQMEVGWGEHLEDGRCRTSIEERNFSATVRLHQGRNCYMNPFRRLGCRYLQFFIHINQVKIYYAGLRPTVYPLSVQKYKCKNLLRDQIYAVSQHTLIQCMHEHYEDCPWREQAFYTLDSRNQMLCGYYAFSEYAFPRAGLRLISKSVRDDGMLPICYPADSELCIPSFTLFYVIQLTEYYRYSKDKENVRYCFDCVKRIMDSFISRIDETGLISNFDENQGFWNFYEWQPYLDGHTYEGQSYDMCLNALLSWTISHYIELCEVIGTDGHSYAEIRKKLNDKIVEIFYNKEIGLFRISDRTDVDQISVLANAWGYLCGAAEELDCTSIKRVLLKNGADNTVFQVIPATLSMHTFRYEALLKADSEYYKNLILEEIDYTYFKLLLKGATSFWETEKGDKDFDYAGSLCHGWSAMPIYYYQLLEGNLGG